VEVGSIDDDALGLDTLVTIDPDIIIRDQHF
jgi:hypothetical protein